VQYPRKIQRCSIRRTSLESLILKVFLDDICSYTFCYAYCLGVFYREELIGAIEFSVEEVLFLQEDIKFPVGHGF